MSHAWPFGDLRHFHYGVIYADPPWAFENYSANGESRNANQHYDCLSVEEICALPVGHLAARDCVLFLWATNPLLDQAFRVIAAWGFRFTGVAFTWAKRTKNAGIDVREDWHMGLGYGTRQNTETCLMAKVGAPKRRAADVRELVIAPIREHSRKPDRINGDIERLFDGPYVELFAQTPRPGWDVWGNQVDKFSEGVTACHPTA